MSGWGALAQVASSAIQSAAGLYQSSKSERAAAANLASQLAWERERATNAHQWEVADLRAAGLNPILSATGGSGAKTSAITPQMPDFSGISQAGSALGSAVARAYEVMTADNNLRQQDANIALTLENAKKTVADTANTAANTLLLTKTFEKVNQEIALLREQVAGQGFTNYMNFQSPKTAFYHNLYGDGLQSIIFKALAGELGDYSFKYDPNLRKLVPRTPSSTAKDLVSPKEPSKNPWSTYKHPHFRR